MTLLSGPWTPGLHSTRKELSMTYINTSIKNVNQGGKDMKSQSRGCFYILKYTFLHLNVTDT